ncbi:LYR motif-containing protein 4 isoform X2 [Hyposmocoma kahamanoa]|uniref:LYR motif-containing protein 4 isoform X2 n=1 Tax=Hyposmocoma kahamanoa TaxID=1477025 RepID=UPI000E6DA472|nr:LYR motif-containing protein 4 isoform X2 [Hyposmocoma kahamanoa]
MEDDHADLMRVGDFSRSSTCRFLSYSLRRVRDAFKENKGLTDQKHIKKEIEFAKQSFGVIQRQAAIGDMYKTEKLVIENMR